MGSLRRFLSMLLLGLLAACSSAPEEPPRPAEEGRLELITRLPRDPVGEAAAWLDFGRVALGESRTMELVFRNVGGQPLILPLPEIAGPFLVARGGPDELLPGEEGSLMVQYIATEEVSRRLITVDDVQLALTGTGAPCLFTLSRTEIHFGSAPVGVPIIERFSIRNEGEVACTLSGARVVGSPEFSLQTGSRIVVAPGLESQVAVVFQPGESTGARQATLSFDVSGRETSVSLSGDSRSDCLRITGADVPLEVGAGCFTREGYVRLENTCSARVDLTGVAFEPEEGPFRTWLQTGVLREGERQDIRFNFYPIEEGRFEAELKLFGHGGVLLGSAPLVGLGTSPLTEARESWRARPMDVLDVLVVIDDTPAMNAFEKDLDGFMAQLQESLSGHDFQLGIITTSVPSGPAGGEDACPAGSGELISDEEGPAILLPTTPDWGAIARSRLSASPRCRTRSEALEAAWRAVDPVNHLNPGFIRDGSYVWLLFLAPTEDGSPQTTSYYANRFSGAFEIELWSGPGACVSGGDRWADFASRVFASRLPICRTPWNRVSEGPQGQPSRFWVLGNTPADLDGDKQATEAAGEMSVAIDGQRLPQYDDLGRRQWRYDEERGRLVLETPIVPHAGEEVSVTYQLRCR